MKVLIGSESIDIGKTPACLRMCGFSDCNEVAYVAQKNGHIMHPMRLDDVAAFFNENNREGNKQ